MGEKIIVILSDFFKHSAYIWSKNEGVRRPIFVVSYYVPTWFSRFTAGN